jgi:hypothetical protein
MNKAIYILFIFSFLALQAFSQGPDTIQTIRAVRLNAFNNIPEPANVDTFFFQTHLYTPTQKIISSTFLGNAGQAFINNYIPEQIKYRPFLFHIGIENYLHTPYNTLHYNTRKPFTELRYTSSGSRLTSEQVIKALHTQNINPHANIGLDFDVIASKGLYLRQDALANRFSLFGSYDKDNYSMYASINTNRFRNQENGGIINIDNFLDHPGDDPLLYPVFLNNANSSAKRNTFFATQSYRFLNNSGDSTRAAIAFLPAGAAVNHTFEYSRFIRTYFDLHSNTDTLGFYQDNFYDIFPAKDSAFMHSLSNAFTLSFMDKNRKNLLFTGIKHQFQGFAYRYPQTIQISDGEAQRDTVVGLHNNKNYNNISVNGSIQLNINKFSGQINGEYFLTGYRANDITANISMNKRFGAKESLIKLGGSIALYEPDYFLQNYSSAHFNWVNDFTKTFDSRAEAGLFSQNGMIYVNATAGMIKNFIFFNEMAMPEIKENSLYYTSVTVHKGFNWSGLNHTHDVFVQVSSDDQALRVPLYGYKGSLYYENAFFKRVLQFQLGFDFSYTQSYFADSYMPALGIFYQQGEMKINGYPFLDGFLNWKVKRTRFFLKYTNALAGFAGHNYFTAHRYPMNWESLKFGLAWTFYD